MSPRVLAALLLLALVVRVAFVLDLRADDGPAGALANHLLGDERAYDRFAREVAAGTVQRERAFYQEPLYAWLVGQVYRAWPPAEQPVEGSLVVPGTAHEVVFALQHVLGLLTVWLTARLGQRALSARAGLIAGLLAALSGPLVFHERMLLKETLSLPLLLAALHLWLDLLLRGGRIRAVLLGLCLGLGAALRGNLLLLVALAAASLLLPLGLGTPRRRAGAALLLVLGALLALSPLTIHNLRRDDLVLSTYQSGTNAAIGNPAGGDPTAGLTYTPLRAGQGDAWYEERDAVALAEAGAGRRLSGREVSGWWWAQVRQRWAAEPAVALARAGLKLAHLFHGDEVADVKDWAFVRRGAPWLATPVSDLRLWGPLALLGFLVLPWRRQPGLFVVRGGVAVIGVSLALFYVMGRYRLSAAPCLWILAAGLVDRWWGLWPARRARLALEGAAGLGLVAAGLAIELPSDQRGDHLSFNNSGIVALNEAEAEADPVRAEAHRARALEWARRSVSIAPYFPDARRLLVRVHAASRGTLEPRPAEAHDAAWRLLLLMEGLRTGVQPGTALLDSPLPAVQTATLALLERESAPGGEAFAGPLLSWAARSVAQEFRSGEEAVALALRLIEHALAVDPSEPLAHTQHGLFLRRAGRFAEAEAAYRRALALGPPDAVLLNNLGRVLLDLERPAEAEACFRQGLVLRPDDPTLLANLERARSGG